MSNKRTIILKNPNDDRVDYVKIMASGSGMVLDTQTSGGLYLNVLNGGGLQASIGSSGGFQIFDNANGNGGLNVNLTGQAPIQLYSGTPTGNGSGYILLRSDTTIAIEANQNVNGNGSIILRNKGTSSPGGSIVLTNHDNSQRFVMETNPAGADGIQILNAHKKMYINNTASSAGGIEIVNSNNGNIQIMNTSPSSYVLINHAVGGCQLYMDDTGALSLGSQGGMQITNHVAGNYTVLNDAPSGTIALETQGGGDIEINQYGLANGGNIEIRGNSSLTNSRVYLSQRTQNYTSSLWLSYDEQVRLKRSGAVDDLAHLWFKPDNSIELFNNYSSGTITIQATAGDVTIKNNPSFNASITVKASGSIEIAPYNSYTTISAGIRYSIATVNSTPTTVPGYAHIVLFDTDTAASNITANLNAASTMNGQKFVLKNIGSIYNVIVEPNGAETIEGDPNFTLLPGESIDVICNGTAWYII